MKKILIRYSWAALLLFAVLLFTAQQQNFSNGSAGAASTFPVGTDTGAANAYVVSNLSPAMLGTGGIPVSGSIGCFTPANAATNGAPTVAFSGLNAITIQKPGGALAASLELTTGHLACMFYDATAAKFMLMDATGATGTGFAVQGTSAVLSTKTTVGAILSTGTTFTLSSNGCAATTLLGGAATGSVASGTTGTCAFTVTIGSAVAAANGWACTIHDLTTPTDVINQLVGSTTTASFSGTTVSGDVIAFSCQGY